MVMENQEMVMEEVMEKYVVKSVGTLGALSSQIMDTNVRSTFGHLIIPLPDARILNNVCSMILFQFQAPAKAIFNISCILILACVPLRFLKLEGEEGILLTFAAPMSWFFLLFFLR